MRKIIFIVSAAIFTLSLNACKTQKKASDTTTTITSVGTGVYTSVLDGKYWKLIELNGNPVVVDENSQKEAHITFNIQENRFSGDAGCNRMTGSFHLKGADEIIFSQTAATRMMCINNMDTETQFLKVLEETNKYTVKDDTLTFFKDSAPIARFVAVYLR